MQKLKAFSVISLLIGILIITNAPDGVSKKVQPPVARTGAPNETKCSASGCHTSSSGGTGNISVSFSDAGNMYVPDSIYTLTVTVTDPVALKYGFEITALTTSNQAGGTLMKVSGDVNTSVQTITTGGLSGRIYIGHNNASTVNSWTVLWQAPSAGIGDVKFYYTGIGANSNNSASGDKFYEGNSTITFGGLDITKTVLMSDIGLQNPTSNSLNLNYTLTNTTDVNIELYDMSGRKVMDIEHAQVEAGKHNVVKPLNGLASGLYMVKFNAGNVSQTSKVLVL